MQWTALVGVVFNLSLSQDGWIYFGASVGYLRFMKAETGFGTGEPVTAA